MRTATRPPLQRLLVLDRAIRSGRYPNAFGLARELEVAHRTIQRDIQFLRDRLNAPLQFDPAKNGFYYAESDFSLPFGRITEGELVALFLAEQVLRQYSGTPFAGELAAAFKKLTAALPKEININLDDLSSAYSVRRAAKSNVGDVGRFRHLAGAVQKRRQLELVYWSASSGATAKRVVDPYQLALVEGDWYLIAHCHLREDVRMFVPGRIRSMHETGKTFERPADFRLADYFDKTFRVVRGDGRRQTVRLLFTPAAARYVRERTWHPSQKLRERKDGSLELSFEVDHLLEVKRWVLSFGAECRVLGPEELVDSVRAETARLLAAYQDGHAGEVG